MYIFEVHDLLASYDEYTDAIIIASDTKELVEYMKSDDCELFKKHDLYDKSKEESDLLYSKQAYDIDALKYVSVATLMEKEYDTNTIYIEKVKPFSKGVIYNRFYAG